jgi:TolB protein
VTTNIISDEHPDWSPGQSRIAFDRLEGQNLDIYTMNADGSELRRLTQDPARDRNRRGRRTARRSRSRVIETAATATSTS